MMTELGKHAGIVLAAYGATVLLLGGLVVASWIAARRAKKALDEIENG